MQTIETSADADFLKVWEHFRAVRRLEVRSAVEDFTTGNTLLGFATELRGRANALLTDGANRQMLELIDDDGEGAGEETPSPPRRADTPR